jgi:hypothetical protein
MQLTILDHPSDFLPTDSQHAAGFLDADSV